MSGSSGTADFFATVAFLLSCLSNFVLAYCEEGATRSSRHLHVCRHQGVAFWQQQGFGEIPFGPILLSYTNTVLWLKYGMAVDDIPMCLVNSLGLVVTVGVTVTYYVVVPAARKPRLETQMCGAFGFLAAVLLVVRLGWVSIEQLGVIATACSMAMLGAPLSSILWIVRMHDSSPLHPPMIASTMASCSVWMAYGVARKDRFLVVPNAIGVLLACAQGGVWYFFRKRSGAKSDAAPQVFDMHRYRSLQDG